ncbi:MAG: serine protease spb1 [Deltaproteobacteria bacterium]
MIKSFLWFFFVISTTKFIWAAPCCGGTANVPSLISGDDSAQVSATFLYSQIVAEAPVGGGIKYRKSGDNEIAQTLKLDAATLISDRWQMGLTVPITRRARVRGDNKVSSSGLGDLSLNVGYEALPSWTYSSWRPKALVFLSATFPTGGSIYDATQLYRIDSRGRGFYSLSAGSLILKTVDIWDLSLVVEGHRAFSRTVRNESGDLILNPGWGISGTLNVGLSPMNGDFRLGIALSPSYEDPVSTEGIFSGKGEKISLWTSSLLVSYMASDLVSMTLTYSDQTLIRASDNSALNKTIGILIQKRWDR